MKDNFHNNVLKRFLRKGTVVEYQKSGSCSFEYPIVESTVEQEFCASFIDSCESGRESLDLKRAWLRWELEMKIQIYSGLITSFM